ncbi:MAG: phosphoribosyltransferase [Oligoflexia bacterium]|nr:phosphoribosyltransferase [Oligoflexia bacterium]
MKLTRIAIIFFAIGILELSESGFYKAFASDENDYSYQYKKNDRDEETILKAKQLDLTYEFMEAEYIEIRDISLEILKRCPPKECIVIGIGRSPTPIIAFIHGLLESESAWNLPLSNFRYGRKKSQLQIAEGSKLEKHLFSHFNNHLPTKCEIADKNILLVDFTDSGATLLAAEEYIKKYLSTLGIDQKRVDRFAFYSKDNLSMITQEEQKMLYENFIKDNKGLNVNGSSVIITFMYDEYYEEYAQYGKFDISSTNTQQCKLEENERYQELVDSIQQIMKIDPLICGRFSKRFN